MSPKTSSKTVTNNKQQLITQEAWGKMPEWEDPDLTSSHGYTEATTTCTATLKET